MYISTKKEKRKKERKKKNEKSIYIETLEWTTFQIPAFGIQLKSAVFNELIEAFDVSQMRLQPMSGDSNMVHCIPIDKGPGSIFAFPVPQIKNMNPFYTENKVLPTHEKLITNK